MNIVKRELKGLMHGVHGYFLKSDEDCECWIGYPSFYPFRAFSCKHVSETVQQKTQLCGGVPKSFLSEGVLDNSLLLEKQ